jgi:hypothetical protein
VLEQGLVQELELELASKLELEMVSVLGQVLELELALMWVLG